jgi:hypothetical protein
VVKPALRQPEPPPRDTWWAKPMTREQWMESAKQRAQELNAEKTYVPRAGDFQ